MTRSDLAFCSTFNWKNAITQDYYNAIIESTIKNGPYYIIANDLAMPHAQSERGVKENAFSLITLKKPVFLTMMIVQLEF